MGGTLMEETISRMAGSENGSARSVAELTAIATAAGRPVRQRTHHLPGTAGPGCPRCPGGPRGCSRSPPPDPGFLDVAGHRPTPQAVKRLRGRVNPREVRPVAYRAAYRGGMGVIG